nr:hypothetical protein [Tanacetum cinerariifolium]
EIVINSNDDYSSSDDDSPYNENIEYVEASPYDSELISLEVAEIVILDDEEIEDDNLREKVLNVNLLIAKIEALKDNPTPSSKLLTKSSSTSPKSFLEETNTFDDSLPEFENFCFDLEEISSGSTTTPWDRVFKIKDAFENEQYKPEDIQELFRKLLDDLQNILEELAEYINSPGWNRPAIYEDDDDVDYTISIIPVLSIEEPNNSLSMGDEHLDTILETESDEVIKSSVEDLVPIPSESKGIPDTMCDVHLVNNPTPFDHDVNPPHIDECCYECGDALDGISFQQCTCKSCGKGAHIGYNCPPKVPIISNPEPCNQNMNNEPPQTLPSFDPTCYSEKENSVPCISKPNFVDESSNVFNLHPQPPIYSCEFCESNAQYGHYCTPQVPFINSEPGYSQAFNFPQDIHDFQQQYLCCDQCKGPHKTFQYEVIKSSVENLVPIPSESEVMTTLYNENIEYVEASPHDSELVSLEVAEIVSLKDEEIEDDNLREKLLNVNFLIVKIEAQKDNLTPSSEFLTKSSSTILKSFLEETNTFDNSLPEFENFYFDLEEISSGSTTTQSDISLSDYEAFYFHDDHIDEISNGSTTTHFDISLSKYDSFIFNLSNDQFPPTDRSDFAHEEFADELAHIISPLEYDCFYFRNLPDPGKWISILNSRIRENLSSTTRVNLPVEDDHSLF